MIDFVWRVPTAGYKWCRQDGERLVEIAQDASADPYAELLIPVTDGKFRDSVPEDDTETDLALFREFRPLTEHTGLFREFAATKRTRAGIKDFADRYGNLGAEFDVLGDLENRNEPLDPPGDVETMEEYAEWLRTDQWDYRSVDSLARWESEIQRMRKCLADWDAVQQRSGNEKKTTEVLRVINNALYDHRVGVGVGRTPKQRNRAVLQFVPVNLAGALWVQFARAVAGNCDYRQCEQCRRWYELNPDTARTSRLYCGDPCRSRHYRAKKASARQLNEAGCPLKAIAEELETDVKTLQGWLKSG